MSDDTENLTIRLLQEMRTEMRERFDSMEARFEAIDERFDEVNTRIDGLTYIITMMAANMGGHEERPEKLEQAVETLAPR